MLKSRRLATECRARLIDGACDGRTRWWPLRAGRQVTAVLATIVICTATVAAAPHALWVIGQMSPVSAQKRQAARVLMDFLDQGWADKLGLKATEAVAAVSPDHIGREDTLGGQAFTAGGRGVVFYGTELYAPRALGYAVSSGFDGGFILGSSIQFAFRSEDRDRIRQAIEQVNAGRVRVEERGIFYSSLRAGPAGKWTGDYLGAAPAPASGLVAYGPYIDLEAGQYRLSYRLKLASCGESARQQLRIRLGVTANVGKMLPPTQFSVQDVKFSDDGCNAHVGATFTVADSALGRSIEFPLWNEGPIAFLIEDITLVRVQEGAGSPVQP